MLKLAPEIIGNWLRRACNQAETSSRALSFVFSSKVTAPFQAYAFCKKEQPQVGRNRFANWFCRNSYSCLGFFFFKPARKQRWKQVCFSQQEVGLSNF